MIGRPREFEFLFTQLEVKIKNKLFINRENKKSCLAEMCRTIAMCKLNFVS